MLETPYQLIAFIFFFLALLVIVVLWCLDKIGKLERDVLRLKRAEARRNAFLRSIYREDHYAPEDGEATVPRLDERRPS